MSKITFQGAKIQSFSDSPKPVTPPLILDTLAQLESEPQNRLLKRARSKYVTGAIAIGLADLKTALEKYYRNAYYCNHTLVQQGDTVTGKYCNTRICNICNRIRTAKLINGYSGALQKMENPKFVTLTRTNVTAALLPVTLDEMCNTFRAILKINSLHKQRYGKSVTHNGIRKIEITYNVTANTFHPHFHIVTDGASAEVLRSEWLERNAGVTDIQGQNIRPVDKNTLVELFKYSTKIVTQGKQSMPFEAIDVIMRSLYRRRVVQPYGAIRRVSEDVDELRSDSYPELPEYELMQWVWEHQDWVNLYGECLTGYSPDVEKCNGTQ